MLTLGEIFNDCFYVQLLLSVHKLNDIIHIINGRGFLAFPYRRSWNFRNILYDAERWLLRHGIKQKAIHIE